MNERIFCRYYKKTSRDSGDKYTNSNNSAAFMGLKNVSTDIIASSDREDIKIMSSPVSIFVLKQETNKPAKNLISPLSLAVSMPEMKVIFEEREAIFEYGDDRRQKIVHIDGF